MKRIFSWFFWGLWLILIFMLSSQPGSESSELSGSFLNMIQSVIPIPELSLFLVRKGAHFFLYFMLGIFTLQLFKHYQISLFRLFFYSFLFCILYSISDEVHQLFIVNRHGSIIDVCIDSIGSFLGILFCYFVKYINNHIHKLSNIT